MKNVISHEKNIDAMIGAIEQEIGSKAVSESMRSARGRDTVRHYTDTVDIAKC